MDSDLIVIGGGAAGFFAAITAKRLHPHAQVTLLEKSAVLLSKVRVSGGGRCNVTHSCFDPALLVKNYPRGEKELLGPFHRFQPSDTQKWFESRGVSLKTEKDGRMFPVTDSSSTIIDCLLKEAKELGVTVLLRQNISHIEKTPDGFQIGSHFTKRLLLATGSSAQGHLFAEQLGHTITPSVPSLFTFNVPNSPLKELSGIAVPLARPSLPIASLEYEGPLLITHFGFSGPAILKLSAWGARFLAEKHYQTELLINWLPHEDPLSTLLSLKKKSPQKNLLTENPFQLPKNLWKALLGPFTKNLSEVSLQNLHTIAQKLQSDAYAINGKTTHKEEFVTCGGVHLKEVNFKTLQSKICPGLFFAGEILDIDGITGGFNFQNAWTTGFIAGSSIFID